MNPLSPSLDELRAVAGPLCRAREVARLELFGSAARGEGGPESDLDFLVEFVPGTMPTLFDLGALQEELAERLHRRVDLVSRRAVERSRNAVRRRAILAAPVPIYVR